MKTVLRWLWFVCILLLVPEQGWCCYVLTATETPTPAEQPPPPYKKSCCHQEPSQPQPPLPKDQPARAFNCCCPTIDTLEPDRSARFAPDAAGLPLAMVLPLPVSGAGALWPAFRYSLPDSASLHLLHCVWLC
jgi:hypothetical protein